MPSVAELRQQPRQVALQQAPVPAKPLPVALSLNTIEGFEGLQRVAHLFASSSLVPQDFRGNIANTFIALEMAVRIGAAPMTVLQNMYIVHGRPSWASQFLVSLFNATKRYSSIKYVFEGEKATPEYGCHAECIELSTKEKIVGPTVTLAMAAQEGWSTKNGSKWKTMPDLMLRYRAAAFLIRTTAPEVGFGLYTSDELHDVYDRPNRTRMDVEEPEQAPVDVSLEEPVEEALEVKEEDSATASV